MQDSELEPSHTPQVGCHPRAGRNPPLTPEQIWADYSETGLSLTEIAKARKLPYSEVRGVLSKNPAYPFLAAERRKQAPADVRRALFKRIDVPLALSMLAEGQSTRAVSRRFGVCTRTLRKRLVGDPEYARIMAFRGFPRTRRS